MPTIEATSITETKNVLSFDQYASFCQINGKKLPITEFISPQSDEDLSLLSADEMLTKRGMWLGIQTPTGELSVDLVSPSSIENTAYCKINNDEICLIKKIVCWESDKTMFSEKTGERIPPTKRKMFAVVQTRGGEVVESISLSNIIIDKAEIALSKEISIIRKDIGFTILVSEHDDTKKDSTIPTSHKKPKKEDVIYA